MCDNGSVGPRPGPDQSGPKCPRHVQERHGQPMKTWRNYLTGAVVAAFVTIGAFRSRLVPVSAADSEDVTWGATDPTWSPDGSTLAFSLFGSIWQVPARGGQAEQVTSSAGYHAHPAWSPKGDSIALVRGTAPQGRIPNIAGKLVLVDVATGREREIETPNPVAGTLA